MKLSLNSNLKLIQLETEKQVAYNQIKRQDDEIRKLNLHILLMQEKEIDIAQKYYQIKKNYKNCMKQV